MALGLEFSNVIARKAAVAAAWPGGLDAFAGDQPNYVEDAALCRVGFMSTSGAVALVDRLQALGAGRDAVALVEHDQPVPEWLTIGDTPQGYAAWLTGDAPTPLVQPFTGFAAEGPLDLIDRLRTWCAGAGIDCGVAPRPLVGGDETVRLRSGEGLIDIDVFADANAGRCRLWAERDKTRRGHLAADLDLCDRLLGALADLGARRL